MNTKIEQVKGCSRLIKIEVSAEELKFRLDQVYGDIGKTARIPGFRPGRAPRDLLKTHYSGRAKEELIRRAIPEYYLKAVEKENLAPVAPPEIEQVQFKDHTLYFSAKVDVAPKVKVKAWRKLRIKKKTIKVDKPQIDKVLENLRQSKAKEKVLPELNDAFAKDLGLKSLDELKEAVNKNLQANAETEIRSDMERQLIDELLKKASLDVPESLVNSQVKEILEQIKMNCILQGQKKEDVQAKEKELEEQARKEAIRRIKLSFILETITQQENIQTDEGDLEKRIEVIAQRSAKSNNEVRQYLERENLIPGLKAELKNRKAMEFLLKEAKISED